MEQISIFCISSVCLQSLLGQHFICISEFGASSLNIRYQLCTFSKIRWLMIEEPRCSSQDHLENFDFKFSSTLLQVFLTATLEVQVGLTRWYYQQTTKTDETTISQHLFQPIQNQSYVSEKLPKCQLFHVVFKSVCNIVICLNSLYNFIHNETRGFVVVLFFLGNVNVDKQTTVPFLHSPSFTLPCPCI